MSERGKGRSDLSDQGRTEGFIYVWGNPNPWGQGSREGSERASIFEFFGLIRQFLCILYPLKQSECSMEGYSLCSFEEFAFLSLFRHVLYSETIRIVFWKSECSNRRSIASCISINSHFLAFLGVYCPFD